MKALAKKRGIKADKRSLSKRKKECKFCKLLREKDNEKVVFENKHIVVILGRAHHKGHLVVMPHQHEEHLMMLHPKTLDSFMNDTIKICRALHKAIKFDRLNLEYLDNWDPHIHWNVYPRFKTDADWGNPPVIPVKGEKFENMELSEKEMKIFKRELERMKKDLW